MYSLDNKSSVARLEANNRTYDIQGGIQAKLKDPLWMLGRQWQTGEFLATNGGHPVKMEALYQFELPETIVKPTDTVGKPLVFTEPLEKKVEDEKEPSAWDVQHLEYSFSIKNSSFELISEEYTGRSLDWYHFSLSKNAIPEVSQDAQAVFPNPITYYGMPSPRWWSFEEGAVNLGDLSRPHFNLLTVLLVEFGLISSQDWYHIPIEHPVGLLRKMISVKTTDSFGIVSPAQPCQDNTPNQSGFELFTIAKQGDHPKDPTLFYLPNNLPHAQESPPIEEISFFRDELANLVWAIEHRYQKGDGDIVQRQTEKHDVEPQKRDLPQYVQKQVPPVYWIPYVLQQRQTGTFLKRGRTYPDLKQYEGRILEESSLIREEEITSSGIKISRVKQLARSIGDGKICDWTGRKKEVDRPQPFSNLAFDQLK